MPAPRFNETTMNFLRKMIVTGFGTGYLPVSGTWGSLVTVVIFLAVVFACMLASPHTMEHHYQVKDIHVMERKMSPCCEQGWCGMWATVQAVLVATAVLASIACVALGDFTERTWKKDPKQCTIDEVAGQAVALLGVPMATTGGLGFSIGFMGTWALDNWLVTAGVCFVLFRIMDIAKPFPARRFEKLPKGWGVLMDDLMAGVYANIAAQVLVRFVL